MKRSYYELKCRRKNKQSILNSLSRWNKHGWQLFTAVVSMPRLGAGHMLYLHLVMAALAGPQLGKLLSSGKQLAVRYEHGKPRVRWKPF